jgi:hypothetical protein
LTTTHPSDKVIGKVVIEARETVIHPFGILRPQQPTGGLLDMRNQYNIKDARNDLKLLNDFLVELGEQIQRRQAHADTVETLMEDSEFSRLMNNIRFFQSEGYKFLAEIYASKATIYQEKVEK